MRGILALGIWGCVKPVVPPLPVGAPAPLRAEAEALAADVDRLAHAHGNFGRLRQLRRRVAEASLPHDVQYIDIWSFQRNVVIELPGASDELVYVVAHWDKTDINPLALASLLVNGLLDPAIGWTFGSDGAVDNATGVAVALRLAQDLAAAPQRRYTWRILLAGSEEAGLRGSRAHVARMGKEERERLLLAINVDTIGVDWAENCLMASASAPLWVTRAKEAAASVPVPLGEGELPAGASSDHVPFAQTGFGRDVRRGVSFNLVGGLLPQASWFTGRHEGDVLFYSTCDALDAGDVVGSLLLVPTGRLHGPRDHAGRVDPQRLWEGYAAVRALVEQIEAGAYAEP